MASIFPLVVALSIILLIVGSPLAALAHEAGEEQKWLISRYVSGTLVVNTDTSIPQWAGAEMLAIEERGVPLNLMSINNGSFFMIMVQRGLNTSLNQAGVAIRFGAEDFNVSSTVWAWARGRSLNDSTVETASTLNAGVLTVVLGSSLAASDTGIPLKIGTPYDSFVRITTWNNGSSLGSMDIQGIEPVGLELVPYMDLYPKMPLVYSGVILAAGLGFIFLEVRRYRGQKD
ncbi:MAG: hypothetical protein HY663_06695 [Chloroflexi bacterium]|nr:hypothetical protein [Chloroflexota bacterium]